MAEENKKIDPVLTTSFVVSDETGFLTVNSESNKDRVDFVVGQNSVSITLEDLADLINFLKRVTDGDFEL